MDNEKALLLLGFLIVLIVGLNILFAFGGFFGNNNILTGLAASGDLRCNDVGDSIRCGSTVYKSAEMGCASGETSVCANTCEFERAFQKDGRVCPSYCKNVCVPEDVKSEIGK